jgi:hypothetical protein
MVADRALRRVRLAPGWTCGRARRTRHGTVARPDAPALARQQGSGALGPTLSHSLPIRRPEMLEGVVLADTAGLSATGWRAPRLSYRFLR